MKSNNNPKNRRGLIDLQKRQLELSSTTELAAKQRRIQSNLERWIQLLPPEMKTALPDSLPKSTVEKIKKAPLRPPYSKLIIISAEDITIAKFTAYSMLYGLIKGGHATPSEVKLTDVVDGYNNINGMFQSRKWKDYFFNENAKILLIDGSSKDLMLLASRGEDQFWRELIEFTRNNDRLVIITYAIDEEESTKDLFIPSITGNIELNKKIIKKGVFVSLTKTEEEEIKIEQTKAYKGI